MNKTTNYQLFQFLERNRTINKGLVERLKKSILEIGYIQNKAILVNENFTIIDGQHRFYACKELGLPILYQIEQVDEISAMMLLNINQAIWRLNEYVESYAKSGIKCYIDLLEFENTYHLGISSSLTVCLGGSGVGKFKPNKIRNGVTFEINPNRFKIIDFLFECRKILNFWKHKVFVQAVVQLFSRTDVKNIEKILKNISVINQQVNVNDYLIIFENICNHHVREDKKISLRFKAN